MELELGVDVDADLAFGAPGEAEEARATGLRHANYAEESTHHTMCGEGHGVKYIES